MSTKQQHPHAALSRRAAKACNAWIFPQTISRREFAYAVDAAESFEDLSEIYQAAILLTEQEDEPPPQPASPTEAEFANDCHSPEDGRFCEKHGTTHGGPSERRKLEKGTPAEIKEARAAHKKKVLRAPVPTPEMVARGREIQRKVREEGGRHGGDIKGTSKDRPIRQLKLWQEFGGPKRGYIVDPASGVKMHYSRDPKLNPNQYPTFTQGKVFTLFQGGGYTVPNLVPELLRSNQRRGAKPIRKENLE